MPTPHFSNDVSRPKMICEDRGLMEAVPKCGSPEQFHLFTRAVRMVGCSRYKLLRPWLEYVERMELCPTDDALQGWCGSQREQGELMGIDLWGILTRRIGGPGQTVILNVSESQQLSAAQGKRGVDGLADRLPRPDLRSKMALDSSGYPTHSSAKPGEKCQGPTGRGNDRSRNLATSPARI